MAEARRFALRFGNRDSQGAQALSGSSNALVQSGKQGRKAILLFGDTRSGGTDAFACLDCGVAHPVELRPNPFGRADQTFRTGLGVADCDRKLVLHVVGEAPDMGLKGLGPLGKGLDGGILCASLFRKLLKLAASPADRLGECSGALVARLGKAGEMLIELRQGPGRLGHDPLRRTLLLCDPRSQAIERDIGGRDIRCERFCSFCAGPADAGRGLFDERGDGRSLRVDARADLLERSSGTRHQLVRGVQHPGIGVRDGSGSGGA